MDKPVQAVQHASFIGLPLQDATDWASPDDPENPRNFSLSRKICSTMSFTGLAFVSTFAASIYSPDTGLVRQEFQCSEEVAILALALFNLGMALGPLVGSPLSETWGRKAVVLTTTPLFALFTLGAGFSTSVAGLIVCRFFAGMFAAPAIGNASATITDYTAGRYRAVTMSFYYSIPTFGAVFGPVVGGIIVQAKGWRWTQWSIIFLIMVFYVPIIFAKETYKNTILVHRAKKLGVAGPPTKIMTATQTIRYYATKLLIRPAHMLVTEPIVSLVCLYSGFLFGLMYTFVTASARVYQHYYGFDQTQQSLSFLGLIAGTLLAPVPLIVLDLLVYQPRLAKYRASHQPDDQFPPENRLFPAMIASPLMPIFLFVFAWTVRPSIHWIVPILFQGLAMSCSVIIYAPSNLFMMDTYGPLYG